MALLKFFRETALPNTLEPYSLYIVAPPSKPDYIELYATTSDGLSVKRIIDEEDVQALINASLTGLSSLQVVADITARDALVLDNNTYVLVLDATGDNTVSSGSATYVYRASNNTYYKVSEFESLDVVLNWNNITNKPTSSASAIDTAVTNSHTHSNKTYLDKVGQDGNGYFTYNNNYPIIEWTSSSW